MEDLDLVKLAIEAQKNSYSPYSNYAVGAALETKDGKVYKGCNIENAAYGPSNCAERTAIFSAVSNGEKNFKKIAVVGGDLSEYAYPCGVCRQVMNEFCPGIEVIVGKIEGGKIVFDKSNLSELLPKAFGPKNLKM